MIPGEVCLDANIFVAALSRKEVHFEKGVKLLSLLQEEGTAIFEPEIVLFEVGTSLYRKRFRGEISDREVDDLMDLFFRFPLILQWQSSLMKMAVSIANRLQLKGMSDAYYIALAQKRRIPLVTLDADVVRKGRQVFGDIQSLDEILERSKSDL